MKEYEALQTSDSYSTQRLADVCSNLKFIQANQNFAVLGGDAAYVGFNRDKNGVEGFEVSDITVSGTVSGYQLGGDLDNTNLTAEQKARVKAFLDSAIVTKDGQLIILHLAAPKGKNQGPASTTQSSENPDTSPTANPSSSSAPGSNTHKVGGTVGPKPGQPSSFGTKGTLDEGPIGTPIIPEQGAGAGTTPAASPSPTSIEITPSRPVITVTVTTPETHPVTTPATTPPETHPATTPVTHPATTPETTPPTTPPATTPVYKGPAPCNPIAQDCAKAEGGIASPVAIEVLGGLVAFGAATGAVVEKRRKSSVQPKHR